MEDFIFYETKHYDGVQKIYKFDNGYGASVVRSKLSYGGSIGLWEVALIEFDYDKDGYITWRLVYRDDFAKGDVAGCLSDHEVLLLLEWIKSL